MKAKKYLQIVLVRYGLISKKPNEVTSYLHKHHLPPWLFLKFRSTNKTPNQTWPDLTLSPSLTYPNPAKKKKLWEREREKLIIGVVVTRGVTSWVRSVFFVFGQPKPTEIVRNQSVSVLLQFRSVWKGSKKT